MLLSFSSSSLMLSWLDSSIPSVISFSFIQYYLGESKVLQYLHSCYLNKLVELEGIELMPHLEYNHQYLASLDYYLFWFMTHILRSWCFINQEEVEASVKEFLASKDKNCYQRTGRKLVSDGTALWILNYFFFATCWIKQICY